MTSNIEKYSDVGINLQLKSDNMEIKFDFQQGFNDRLKEAISKTYSFTINPLSNINNESSNIYSLVLPKNSWICVRCENLENLQENVCSRCRCFRLVETFPNIIFNPLKVTESEIKYLENRRKKENEIILMRDKLDPSLISGQTIWYLINEDWLREWKSFASNNKLPDCQIRISQNSKIGILPPGQISNYNLLSKDKSVKPNLKKVIIKSLMIIEE